MVAMNGNAQPILQYPLCRKKYLQTSIIIVVVVVVVCYIMFILSRIPGLRHANAVRSLF